MGLQPGTTWNANYPLKGLFPATPKPLFSIIKIYTNIIMRSCLKICMFVRFDVAGNLRNHSSYLKNLSLLGSFIIDKNLRNYSNKWTKSWAGRLVINKYSVQSNSPILIFRSYSWRVSSFIISLRQTLNF